MTIKVILAGVLGLLIAGCGFLQHNSTPAIVSVTPENNAVNIGMEPSIRITFNGPMDTASCEDKFGLFEGSIDEIPSEMAGHLPGWYNWNEDYTEMTFHPSDDLLGAHDYSLCIVEGMEFEHPHVGMMMNHDHDGMMSLDMRGFGRNAGTGIIITFTTL